MPRMSTENALVAFAFALALAACSRTGLLLDGAATGDAGIANEPFSADDEMLPDARPPRPDCEPAEEICNGVDDDCDGDVDEVTPIPCPGGGSRYCVGGRMSECPTRCDVCLPGSIRTCFVSYCTYWGEQVCAADGRGFSACSEEPVPDECKDVATEHQKSPELEQCCIDNGYCCTDDFDLDHDGNRNELLGRCDEVTCE